MSNTSKGKYEVIRVLRKNILEALIAMGQYETTGGSKTCTWSCIEASQQSPRNRDRVITMKMTASKPSYRPYSRYDGSLGTRTLCWAETQTWEICALLRRKASGPADPVTAETITAEDALHYMALWFDTVGVEVFRANGMANNFVGVANIKTYNDESDSGQDKASMNVDIQVPRKISLPCEFATPMYKGSVGI